MRKISKECIKEFPDLEVVFAKLVGDEAGDEAAAGGDEAAAGGDGAVAGGDGAVAGGH